MKKSNNSESNLLRILFVMLLITFTSIMISYLCVGKNRDFNMAVMKIFSVFNCIYFICYKVSLKFDKTLNFNFFNELPFQLCNVTTIILPLGLFFDLPVLQCFCFVMAFFGPMMAIVMPDIDFIDMPRLTIRGIGYYGYHALLVISSICLISTGIYVPSYVHIPAMVALLIVLMFMAHGLNYLFRKYHIHDNSNYMYTYGLDTNPILRKIKEKIPYNALYLLPLIPVAGIVGCLMTFVVRIIIMLVISSKIQLL